LSHQVEQHAINAVCAYLTSQLAAEYPNLPVFDAWPESSVAMKVPAVSVFLIGTAFITEIDPEPVGAPDFSTSPPTYTWALRFADYPFQVDVWAASDSGRKKLAARIEAIFKHGRRGLGLTNVDPFENDLLVAMTGDFEGTANASIKAPEFLDMADTVNRNEYRAMMQGLLSVQTTFKAQSPRLTNPTLSAVIR
jgi:hypothetical protein